MLRKLAATAALMLIASPQLAAQTLVVESVVSPAWLERGGKREPLAVSTKLSNQDKVHTGAGSRALLRMAEGSAVKLGENAILTVDNLSEKKNEDRNPLVTAALDVARGAFRFTTGLFGKRSAQREVKIRIATVTAGIRGTDVWGKSEAERDIVCLIEGRIAVEHAGRQFTMDEPLSFFIAPRKEKPRPVAPVSKQQMETWAEETEIREGAGAIRRGGKYGVDVAATPDYRDALQARNKAREAGFAVELETIHGAYGGDEYRVRVGDLASSKDADALSARLKSLGFAESRPVK